MSLTAVKPGGWAIGEILTSDQMDALQSEMLKAVDGVNGGSYTLGSSLTFAGADVRIAADLEILSTGQINANSGSEINVDSGAQIDVAGDLNLLSGGDLNVLSGGEIAVDGNIEVASGGIVNLNSGGRMDVNSGADFNVESGATLDLTGTMTVGATGNVNVASGGNVNLQSGADLIAQSGGSILIQSGGALTAQNGATVQVEDSEDLVINDAPEEFRHTLVAAFHESTGAWDKIPNSSGELGWYQTDVADDRAIWFALATTPGDTLVSVFVRLDGDKEGDGHAALPATRPRVQLLTTDIDGNIQILATVTDSSANVAAYDAPHNVILQSVGLDSGTMPQLATIEPFYVRVYGETGANSEVGLGILSISGNTIARHYRTDTRVY